MKFFQNLKRSLYFKKNASRFVKHVFQHPCDVVSRAKDGLWAEIQAQDPACQDQKHFENVLYMTSIAARCAHELASLEERHGIAMRHALERELVFRSEQVFGNKPVFEELLNMARTDRAKADPGLSQENLFDLCLHTAAQRLTKDQACCAPATFAVLRDVFTEGGLVADLIAQESP